MSDVFKTPSNPGPGIVPPDENTLPDSPRIRLDVPLGTPFREIQMMVFRQAWELAGSQFKAAIALGVCPITIWRHLSQYDRDRLIRPLHPEARPMAESPAPLLPEDNSDDPRTEARALRRRLRLKFRHPAIEPERDARSSACDDAEPTEGWDRQGHE